MATLIPNSFASFALTEEEELRGSLLQDEQKFVIQNLLSNLAEEKLALAYDPINTSTYLQREAELQGQIGILKYLLAQSTSAEEKLKFSLNHQE